MSKAKQILKASKKIALPLITVYAMTTCIVNDSLLANISGIILVILMVIDQAITNQLVKTLKEKIKLLEGEKELFCKTWKVPYNSTLSKSTDKTVKVELQKKQT